MRPRDIADELPDQSVIQGPNPTDFGEANHIYGNTIIQSPHREAALYRNRQTGEFVVVQGEETVAAIGRNAAGELEAPEPGGTAQRWKEVLESPDIGRWELVSHFHPADLPGGGISLPARMPSGVPGDFASIEGKSAVSGGQPRQSRIHYLEKGRVRLHRVRL